MQNQILFNSITIEELKNEISLAVQKEIQSLMIPANATNQPESYLTRFDVAKIFGVSLPTLNEWTKTGKVQGYRISSRVRYKRSEIENALSKIQTRR